MEVTNASALAQCPRTCLFTVCSSADGETCRFRVSIGSSRQGQGNTPRISYFQTKQNLCKLQVKTYFLEELHCEWWRMVAYTRSNGKLFKWGGWRWLSWIESGNTIDCFGQCEDVKGWSWLNVVHQDCRLARQCGGRHGQEYHPTNQLIIESATTTTQSKHVPNRYHTTRWQFNTICSCTTSSDVNESCRCVLTIIAAPHNSIPWTGDNKHSQCRHCSRLRRTCINSSCQCSKFVSLFLASRENNKGWNK